VALAEASANLARYDGVRYGLRSKKAQTVEDLFLKSRQEGLGQEVKRRILLGTHVLSTGYYDAYYMKARKVQALIQKEHEKMFEKVDFLLTPTTAQTAFALGSKLENPLEMYQNDLFTVCANHAALPAISFPMALDASGLPIGMQLVAPFMKDVELLSLTARCQKAFPFEERPTDV
jgi:aspartyl-tRNA(Asn)/glutamyl-tRNA(Gln) amidotransferase subunit A